MTPQEKRVEEDFKIIFGPERGPTAFGIYLCLVYGDTLPKDEFAGVSVEEVREMMRLLRLAPNNEGALENGASDR